MRTRNIYLGSSWRNEMQPDVLYALRSDHHEVYDFRNPAPGNNGFAWGDMDRRWQEWSPSEFRDGLSHPIAIRGFLNDWTAMEKADTCVLLLPCGRSAHLEAGYFVGAGKDLFILLGGDLEPELMYLMAGHERICLDVDELLRKLSV